ncbi:MAG TPA: Nif3-like dinuclear metal center hexameric protein [Chromobacteriaceae bacterium]|nr:Nif3-like dinuclear metal center hexameric protein [Chromobacteriaceae bacterium]
MKLTELVGMIDAQLQPWQFKDYAPNGLQVEGKEEVKTLVTGVTASMALIDAAIASQADAILVHHGYFWKGEDARVVGMKRARLAKLLAHGISLLAYHLPLDAHPVLGNNACLAEVLGFAVAGQCGEQNLLWHGSVDQALTAQELTQRISSRLGRDAILLGEASWPVERVAWCTGGAQGFFDDAIALGVQAFITGEVSEQNYHMAHERGVAFIAAGHHATERYGIQALGEWIAGNAHVKVKFVDVFNPV